MTKLNFLFGIFGDILKFWQNFECSVKVCLTF